MIKLASSYHVFSVDEPLGLVLHTPPSRALVKHRAVRDSLKICLDERFLSTAGLVDHAMLKFGSIDEPTETAFNIAFNTSHDHLSFMRNPDNSEELSAMHGFLGFVMGGTNMGARNHDMDTLAGDTIDWEALGDGLVVDVSIHITFMKFNHLQSGYQDRV